MVQSACRLGSNISLMLAQGAVLTDNCAHEESVLSSSTTLEEGAALHGAASEVSICSAAEARASCAARLAPRLLYVTMLLSKGDFRWLSGCS